MSDGEYTPTTDNVKSCYAYYNSELDIPMLRESEREFDRWLTAHDREVAAGAWDEGATAGFDNASLPTNAWEDNPYRQENS